MLGGGVARNAAVGDSLDGVDGGDTMFAVVAIARRRLMKGGYVMMKESGSCAGRALSVVGELGYLMESKQLQSLDVG